MESKWRMNAFEGTTWVFGATLCARLLEGMWTGFYLSNQDAGGGEVWVYKPLGPGVWIHATALARKPGHPNFPYGWAVEPDALP